MSQKVRIGIDVGGTFTDAVLICNKTGEIIAKAKTPTSHYHKNGVAQGIVEIVEKIMKENNISPDDVVFIAHGTTQATNALLEGDVARVGVIGVVSSFLAKKEVTIKDIELAPNKFLHVETELLDPKDLTEEKAQQAIDDLLQKDCEVIVVSQEYAVDDATYEREIAKLCEQRELLVTTGHQISELYGLKLRTKTAVVNASLIPKMLETANMTEKVVKDLGIKSELMIMRADGGVMSVAEIRQRPILTMLSGLAAGVAGALIYEKVTDGIFMEVGGTSIDISVIKDGKVMVNNALIGNQKIYLKALDVRTLAVAGGSMIRVKNNKIIDVGPRSAHLAHKDYECFSNISKEGEVKYIKPLKEDTNDYVVFDSNGEEYAYTLAGAANLLGYVPEGDYAKGNLESIKNAWNELAKTLSITPTEAAQQVMDIASEKIWKIVDGMIKEYKIDSNFLQLVGGGGSASVTTQALAQKYEVDYKIADNAPFISTIGVALALVREQIERSSIDPSSEEIKQLRIDITNKILESGAKKETIQVDIEIDSQKNLLRATATAATEFSEKAENSGKLTEDELIDILANGYEVEKDKIKEIAKNEFFNAYEVAKTKKTLLGLSTKKVNYLCVINNDGVILNRLKNGKVKVVSKTNCLEQSKILIEENSTYSDAGKTIPKIYMFCKYQHYDYSGLINEEQVKEMMQMDLENTKHDEVIFLTAEPK